MHTTFSDPLAMRFPRCDSDAQRAGQRRPAPPSRFIAHSRYWRGHIGRTSHGLARTTGLRGRRRCDAHRSVRLRRALVSPSRPAGSEPLGDDVAARGERRRHVQPPAHRTGLALSPARTSHPMLTRLVSGWRSGAGVAWSEAGAAAGDELVGCRGELVRLLGA